MVAPGASFPSQSSRKKTYGELQKSETDEKMASPFSPYLRCEKALPFNTYIFFIFSQGGDEAEPCIAFCQMDSNNPPMGIAAAFISSALYVSLWRS